MSKKYVFVDITLRIEKKIEISVHKMRKLIYEKLIK